MEDIDMSPNDWIFVGIIVLIAAFALLVMAIVWFFKTMNSINRTAIDILKKISQDE